MDDSLLAVEDIIDKTIVVERKDSKMRVYVNQAGYLPNSRKIAILAEEGKSAEDRGTDSVKNIKILNQSGECVLEKEASYFGWDEASQDMVWHADFSQLTVNGEYQMIVNGESATCQFRIGEDIYRTLNYFLCKALYFQRCGMALEEQYAGVFHRESCHEGMAIRLEDYEKFEQGSTEEIRKFDVRGGWHDAGDYGRYTTAAATALAHIFYAYQLCPNSFEDTLNIPESGNGIPDILNECLYELRWLLKMQMEDGSVCHKLTSMRHANFVMPNQDLRQMILFPVSTMAVGDFAAIMALASRIYGKYDHDFAQTALQAAKKAWGWLENHPEFIGFKNPSGSNTGEYEDKEDWDERLWAACELYRSTKESAYLDKVWEWIPQISDLTAMGWADVAGFAGWALLEEDFKYVTNIPECEQTKKLKKMFKDKLMSEADKIQEISSRSGYLVAMENEDYGWGSNMILLNRAMILATAYLLEPQGNRIDCIVSQMDYLLGVNAVGYSYVTGIGAHSCQNPHNRVTVSDGIKETIPGFVSGGANKNPVDEKAEWLIEPGVAPMKCFLDIWECYSLNEITIYWNSPAIFVAAFLEAFSFSFIQDKAKTQK